MRAVFLDRDGVLNDKLPEGHYVTAPEELQLIPGVTQAVKCLNDGGWLVFLVSNQRGIALGKLTRAGLRAVHQKLEAEMEAAGAHLDGIYVCPHEKDSCDCRKPKPGLLFQAKRDFPQINFGQSVMIGDAESDMEAGKAAGCAGLIKIGASSTSGCICAADLTEAVKLLAASPFVDLKEEERQHGSGC